MSITDDFVCVCEHTLVQHNKLKRGFRYIGRGSCRKCRCKKFIPKGKVEPLKQTKLFEVAPEREGEGEELK